MGILPHESFQPGGKESNRNPFKKTRNFEGRNIPNARLYAKHITSHNACSSCVSYSQPFPSPGITQNNQHKQPQNRCDSDRPYRYESHRHHRCDSHRFKSSRCVHFDQSEATFQDRKQHGFTHHFTSTTNVHPYLPQAATRLIRCSKSCEKCMGEIVTLAKGLET